MKKQYNPKKTEHKIYKMWEEGSYFKPQIDKNEEPFVITLPPPNVTGGLHAGHALYVLEDIMIRYHRMKGDPTLWVPGFDHASIAVEYLVVKELRKEGLTKQDIGREEYLKRAEKFADESRDYIRNQLKKLGFSLDWTREAYTMDGKRSQAVTEAFNRLYENGLIYKDDYIVNWCPNCETAISDLENEYQEEGATFYYIRYGPLTVATTRPETMFADVAVAVHPEDPRYQDYIGREVPLPLTNKKLLVIADEAVDPEFGTGALKITPAHDETDFEIGRRHNLEAPKAINKEGNLTEITGKYQGMTVQEARESVIKDLKDQGHLEKTEEMAHRVGHCQRCGTKTEPLISKQWYAATTELAKPAMDAVKKGNIEIIPKNFEKVFFHWMENIHDWCISRQLWWGHRLPVWRCQTGQNNKSNPPAGGPISKTDSEKDYIVAREKPDECPICGECDMKQAADVLDTWFSSSLWPITTLGWPKKTKDFEYFYPTTVRETGYDILFFWVAKEIMMCMEMTGEIPFSKVYLHGLVRDNEGRKFSKTKGIGFDPLEIIEKYGADALRMALVIGNAPGTDLKINDDKVRGYRNFANKLWNIGRFIYSNLEKNNWINWADIPELDFKNKNLTNKDKEIIKRWHNTLEYVTKNIDHQEHNYRFDLAGEELYHFVWHQFADEYLEYSKEDLYSNSEEKKKRKLSVLRYIYYDILKTLHPFMPFVTEEIWQRFPHKNNRPLIVTSWPQSFKSN